MSARRTGVVFLLLGLLFAAGARAGDQPSGVEPSPEETHKKSLTAINKALTDPVSEAWSIAFQQNNFRISPGLDHGERWSSNLLFQGALPVALNPYWDLITRPSIALFASLPHP